MLSAKDIAAVKVAVEMCNDPELKREILCAPGSGCYVNKKMHVYDRKEQWNEIVERKAAVILEDLGLAKQLQEKVVGIVLLVGMRMLTWAEYHEGTLGFSREYSFNFLNNSFFTQQGIIDNKKAAEELIKDESLNIKQKYKLACLYCFTDHIPALYKQMTKEDKEKFYDAERPKRVAQPKLVKFWSYYLMGEIDMLKGEKSLDQYRLDKAVKSGSKAAVEYCLEKTNLRTKKDAIVDVIVETVRNKTKVFRYTDWVVFANERYKDSNGSWTPSDYYIDILHSLLSKARDDQKMEFLKKDIEDKNHRYSRTLEYFLNWPYQYYFMKTVGLMWEFLPERGYADLLLKICNKIESKKEKNLKYGEGKSFDYRELLKEFWCKSPERFKRYVLNDNEITYPNGGKKTLKKGKELLVKLFTLKNFTYEDRKNIELILADATDEEKENIISSKEGKDICIGLMKEEKWETLDKFVSGCFPSKEQVGKFKGELSLMEEATRICIDFVKNDKWDAAEWFIRWSALPEEGMKKLKEEMISSEDGKKACLGLVQFNRFNRGIEDADRFIRWWIPSEEEVKTFKRELVLSYSGICKCVDLVTENQLELVGEFIKLGLSSKEEIRELKKNVAYRTGCSECEELISHYYEEAIYDEQGYYAIGRTTKFKGGKWEEVEKFLTWCFSSEEEISEFKKKILLEESGISIHSSLIAANKWEEAETFLAWLGLSGKEIRELKKETLLSPLVMERINESLYDTNPGNFSDYAGGKWEKIELYLRWCLIDKNAVFEFKDRYEETYGFKSYENKGKEVPGNKKVILDKFYSLIEELLNDLIQKSERIKRKSEVLTEWSPSKKLCDMELEKSRGDRACQTN